jgi:fucose permease
MNIRSSFALGSITLGVLFSLFYDTCLEEKLKEDFDLSSTVGSLIFACFCSGYIMSAFFVPPLLKKFNKAYLP